MDRHREWPPLGKSLTRWLLSEGFRRDRAYATGVNDSAIQLFDFGMAPKLCIAALVLCAWTFTFLTAGWVNYAVEDGGIKYWDDMGAEYGASFGFTVVM